MVAASMKSSPAVRTVALAVAVAVAACSLYVVFGEPFVFAVRRVGKTIREHYFVPRYLSRLEELVKRLQRLCDQNHSDNVACVLCKFPQLWGGSFKDPPGLGHISRFVDALRQMLSSSRRNRKSLVFSLQWFESIVAMYNELCVRDPARQIVIRSEQGLEQDRRLQYERLKREYHKVRLGYLAFLEDYARFSRDLNSAFGETMARDWFERPEELSGIDSMSTPKSDNKGSSSE